MDMDPRVFKAMAADIESQIEELERLLREYESLKQTESIPLHSIRGMRDEIKNEHKEKSE